MEYALRIRNLTKKYRNFSLQNVSMDIPQGTVVGLIGENGSGKTTFLQSVAGIVPASCERLEVFGLPWAEHSAQILQDLAFLPEDSRWNREYTPLHASRILQDVYAGWDQARYAEYLRRFGVDPDQKLKKMSRGMRIRMELAAAFSRQAKLLILDETTSGLDPLARGELLDLLRAAAVLEREEDLP